MLHKEFYFGRLPKFLKEPRADPKWQLNGGIDLVFYDFPIGSDPHKRAKHGRGSKIGFDAAENEPKIRQK